MHTLTRAVLRLGVICTIAGATLCAGTAVASAAPTTKTTVMTSTDIISSSGSATLTATVTYSGLVVPTGSVTFTDTTNKVVLGTTGLGSCVVTVKQCTATLVVSGSQLAPGQNEIRASYSGNMLSAPSIGVAYLATPDNPGGDVSCPQGQTCTASSTSPDGTARLNVRAGPSSNPGGEVVLISFEIGLLPCSTPNTGDVGVFDVSDPTVSDFVVMATFGAAGANAQAAHPIAADGSGGHVCFDSPTPFTTASGAPAAQQPDGSYAGVLPVCVVSGGTVGNPPCYDGGSFTPTPGGGTYEVRVAVVDPNGDPKMGP